MYCWTLAFLIGAAPLNGAEVVDRIAIIVGRYVVKASNIERDLRASQFLNRQPLDLSPETRRKAAARLIDQELIRQELMSGGYGQPSEDEVNVFFGQLRRDRFNGSETALSAALGKYGLTTKQLRAYLAWQLTVLRFIDRRFRPAVLVTDDDVRAYYEEHRAELSKEKSGDSGLEALSPKIRELITGERVNRLFAEWLDQVRERTRIEYRDPAFAQRELSQ